ncbi:hypothetical protein ETAA8_09470 [Anatilimnocola aggregata]|uniref:Uncharacterized protein n=2 Tax=Anatilimnocola aggregata TaxID=2528021 RepID=A0A517Y6M2_9BACT|nr:hypothetical protein ETAA8_09470 [Anatilimnocola aggregata]
MPVTELEELIATKFANGLNENKVRGSSRTRWQNLVDWVKATLTKRGLTRYVFCGSIRCIAYFEPAQFPTVTPQEAHATVEAAISETVKTFTGCKPPATKVGDWLHARDGGMIALIADAMAQEDATATLEDLRNELESGLGSLQYLLDLGHGDRTLGAPLPEGFDDDNG